MSNLNLKRNLILTINSLSFENISKNEPDGKKFSRSAFKKSRQNYLNKLLSLSLRIYTKLPSRVKPTAKKIGKRTLKSLGRL